MQRLAVNVLVAFACLVAAAPAAAVVGGRDSARAYPHMAALEREGSFICGGSLVAPSLVLTAAHCVADEPRAAYAVGLGGTDRTALPERIPVAEVTVHEAYMTPTSASNDIALLRLARPSTQAPIALLPAAERARWNPGATATVTGWGARVTNDLLGVSSTDRLQEVQVPIASDEACADAYGRDFEARTEVCAGEPGGGRDSCQGDSGGPLTVDRADGRPALVGVVSFGFGCGIPTQYGVYARVADTALRGWITDRLPKAAATPATTPVAKKRPARTTAQKRRSCYYRADKVKGKSARRAAQARCKRLYGRRR